MLYGVKEGKFELKLGVRVLISLFDEEQNEYCYYGTYQGNIPLKTLVENPSLLDFPIPEMEEAADIDTQSAVNLGLLIEKGLETEEFELETGETIFGFQCSWQLADKIPTLH